MNVTVSFMKPEDIDEGEDVRVDNFLAISIHLEQRHLSLKAPITTGADDSHKYFFIVLQRKCLDISCESSARQRIHIKN